MRGLSLLLTAVTLVCVSSSSQATIIHVPTDSTTIQGGINGAVNGDTVMVHPGTYIENIDFLGKAIVVTSEYGADSTVIDGNQSGSVVTFQSGETSNSVIEGFTLTNGSGTYFDPYWEYGGGGIFCNGSAPAIQYNAIAGNVANNGGGIAAVFVSPAVITHNKIFGNSASPPPGRIGGGGGLVVGFDSNPEVSYNDIYDNYSNVAGGGMACGFDCYPKVTNNTIRDNVANVYGGGIQIYSYTAGIFEHNIIMRNSSLGDKGAGGISCRLGSFPVIASNLIIDNSALTYGGGIRCFDDAAPTIVNNLIMGNEADISGGGIECDTGGSAIMTNTILWDNLAPAGTEVWIGRRSGSPGMLTISYSNVEGGIASVHVGAGATLNWGAGMIDVDPLFRGPGIEDFHLMATACGDSLDSPCIDAGDPAVIDSLLDCSHGLGSMRSDIGAYGGRGEHSLLSIEPENDRLEPGVAALPKSLKLCQNHPNPVGPSTAITFDLPGSVSEQQHVSVSIQDIQGRRVKALVDSELVPGPRTVFWDGLDDWGWPVASGVYFYTLRAGGQVCTRRMTVMR
ncbi:hypothetical protein ACFL6M_03345 [Candidatus Eisenbacteria bacterium]|uniref:Right handed beta helix domain-containing protein n=1 Tax=Eiseniibacteriota bacterium TaxID=2212470 RepID=A0ABV6YJV4_UNCEI